MGGTDKDELFKTVTKIIMVPHSEIIDSMSADLRPLPRKHSSALGEYNQVDVQWGEFYDCIFNIWTVTEKETNLFSINIVLNFHELTILLKYVTVPMLFHALSKININKIRMTLQRCTLSEGSLKSVVIVSGLSVLAQP